MTAEKQTLEAFFARLNKLQEDFPSVTLLAVTPEDHNHFLEDGLKAESWDDPRHLAFKERLAEEIDAISQSPWDQLNNLCEKIAEEIKEDEK